MPQVTIDPPADAAPCGAGAGRGLLPVAIALLAMLPVASNRETWWLLWGMLIAGTAAFRLVRCPRPLQSARFVWLFGPALVVPLHALMQAAPLAARLPEVMTALPPRVQGLVPDSLSLLPGASILGAVRAGMYLLFLFLVLEAASSPAIRHRMALVLFAGLVAQAVWGLVALRVLGDIAPWGEKTAYLGALTGTFVNRNSAATCIGFGLILGLALILRRSPGVDAAARFGLLALLGVALLLTRSRMGIAATGLGALMVLVVRPGGTLAPRRVAQVGLVLLVAFLLVLPMQAALVDRLLKLGPDAAARLAIYAQVWGMVQLRPLTGFGYDAFAPAYEVFRAAPVVVPAHVDLAHNSYLTLWAELGVLVGSVPMLLLGLSGWVLLRGMGQGAMVEPVVPAALGALVLGAVHSTADFSLEIPANVFCFLLILGLGLSAALPGKPGAGP